MNALDLDSFSIVLLGRGGSWAAQLSVLLAWLSCLVIPIILARFAHQQRALKREIRQRKKAEEALREANMLLQGAVQEHSFLARSKVAELDASQSRLLSKRHILGAVLESIGEGVVVVNAEGEFTWVNSSAIELVPSLCSLPKYTGDWVGEYTVLDQTGMVVNHEQMPLARAMRGEIVNATELQLADSDGNRRWLRVTARPLPRETGGAVSIFHDITSTKTSLERMEESRDQALRASQVKSEFLAVMSHELRTPLNGVRGMLEFLQESDLTPQQAKYAEIALHCSDSLLYLIDDILDLSKIEAGKLNIRMAPFQLRALLNTVTDMFEPELIARPLKLEVDISTSVPNWFRGDAVRLRQILVNLVGNAVKYSEKGIISLKASYGAEESILVFDVSDQGPGIPEPLREHLFDAFTQADSSSNRQYGGVGLGLAIVSRLVMLLHGKIEYETELGEGTTFRVALPWHSCPTPETVADSQPSKPCELHKLKVLVVEDNPINRNVLILQLEKLGITKVLVAENGEKALEIAGRNRVELILLDCQMPGLDGVAVAELIRADSALYGVPVIVALTAHALSDERERCLKAGMNDFLTKPLAFKLLEDTLRKWA